MRSAITLTIASCAFLACGVDMSPSTPAADVAMLQQELAQSVVDDRALLDVAVAMNAGELEQAQLGIRRAQRDAVRATAIRSIAEHSVAQSLLEVLAEQLQTPPVPNLLSESVRTQGLIAISTLRSVPESMFDRTYLDTQMVVHAQAMPLLTVLIPRAQEPRVKEYLESLSRMIAGHLEEIETLRRSGP